MLDVEAVLCSKAWYVLNEDIDREVLFFKKDNTGYASVNGNTTPFRWEYIPQNNSLLINHSEMNGILLRPAYFENGILACQKDGTMECMFLLDDERNNIEKILTLVALEESLANLEQRYEEQIRLEAEQALKAEEERKRKEEEERQKKAEEERKKKQEEEDINVINGCFIGRTFVKIEVSLFFLQIIIWALMLGKILTLEMRTCIITIPIILLPIGVIVLLKRKMRIYLSDRNREDLYKKVSRKLNEDLCLLLFISAFIVICALFNYL